MATYLDDLTAIRARFRTQWTATYPAVPFVYDNEPALDEPEGIWVRFSVLPGAERRRSIAAQRYEQLGRVYLQIFMPRGDADIAPNDGWKMADSFAASFRDWRSTEWRIAFDVPTISQSDNDDDYYMIIVSVPYTAQH